MEVLHGFFHWILPCLCAFFKRKHGQDHDIFSAISDKRFWQAGILFLNIDRFKLINETLGPEMGDVFLVEISSQSY